ncbi:MAG TPA: type IV toxin-antitoxin system AbiEi family antitoxin domain-containing protein [Nocardioides sp.]|nr:type IV toxin-antitoxin system AbiEi family antitoxin domain-containing protein [Nocardioides sp.]
MAETPQLPNVPFTAASAAELGISRHTLRRMLREGLVRRITKSVYVDSSLPDTVELRAQALALVVRPHQVVCDRTAAWLWGIDVLPWSDHDVLPAVETAATGGGSPCTRAAADGHTRQLADSDTTTLAGLKVTTPLRTALDLACVLERRDALAALDAFRREHGLTSQQLVIGVVRFAKRRGVVQARELIPLSDPRSESVRETWTRLAIIDAGLPAPDLQVWIEVDGVRIYRLDLAYPRHRVAVEYDGWEAHERTEEQRRHDQGRRAWLRRHGWTVIVVRNGDFTGAALASWIDKLRAALSSVYSNRRVLERGDRARRA